MNALFLSLPATIFVFTLGAAIGSFLNVVIYRLPAGISLLYPPSRCPHCQTCLQPKDNVPLLGWLWLRGRCRYCHHPIPIRYPLVELLTGLLFVCVFWGFDFSLPTLGYWTFFSWLVALALIDFDTLTLPNCLTQSGLVVGLLFQIGWGWTETNHLTGAALHFQSGVIGAVVGIWTFDLMLILGSALFQRTAMGGGDAKLAAMMGGWLGWKLVMLAGFLAAILGAVGGGGARLLGWIDRHQPMPFGPFLAIGAILTTFFGEALIAAYLEIFLQGLGMEIQSTLDTPEAFMTYRSFP